jgi:cholest-4-en-3-one 26-monooxygenase
MTLESAAQQSPASDIAGPILDRLEDCNVYDLDKWVRGVPLDEFKRLREEAPVYYHSMPDGKRPFWAVTKYEDVVTVSKNPTIFSSHRGGTTLEDYEEEDLSQIQLLILNMDPPQHAKFRRLVSKGFTPRMVEIMRASTKTQVKEILDGVAHMGEFDFVREIASELPLRVIAELLGVPMEDRRKLFDWSNRLIGFDDPEFQTSIEDARMAAFEIWMYANDLAEERRGTEGKDLIRVLLNAEVEGEKLTEADFDAFFLLLAVAGNETTRNAITGGMITLLNHPDQLQLLRDNPDLMPQAVEEILRFVTPVIHFRRTATQDVELGGELIRENDKVAIFYSSANRDADFFEDPDRFDITRDPNHHLSFGVGEHFCLGSSLARLEIHVLFEELIKRMPDIKLNGDVRRLRSNFVNGVKECPVSWTPQTT